MLSAAPPVFAASALSSSAMAPSPACLSIGAAAAAASPLAPAACRIRRLHPGEADLILAHFLRLGPDARRLRFGNAVNAAFLERYAAMALDSGAVVNGLFAGGILRGIAELRYLTGSYKEAEGAFSIEPAFQGLGHGDRLFGRLIAAARNRGVRRLFFTCLRENSRMQAIAAKHGADLSFVHGEVTAELLRPYADAASISPEWLDESQAFVFALLDWRKRGLAAFASPLRRLATSGAPLKRLAAAFSPRPSRP